MNPSTRYAICNEVYGDLPFEKAFRHARSIGYHGVEIAPFTLGETVTRVTSQRRREIRELAADCELEIIGLHWLLAHTEGLQLTSPDPDVRKRTADYMMELVSLCGDLGGKIMVFGSPQQRRVEGIVHRQALDFAKEIFSQLAPVLKQREVVLALEPLGPDEDNFLNTADATIGLLKELDHPNIRLHLDVKAMATESRPIPEIIQSSREWTAHFHANDPNRQGPGMGDLDFAPVLQALEQSGYDGWISVEVFDYSPGVEALTRQSIDYLRKFESSA